MGDREIKIYIESDVIRIAFDESNQIAFSINRNKRDYTIILHHNGTYTIKGTK